MSSQTKHDKMIEELSVYGYVRENFDERCWIDEIIETIIQFYGNRGGSLYVFGKADDARLGIEYNNKGYPLFHDTPYKPSLDNVRRICRFRVIAKSTMCPPFIDDNAYQVSVFDKHTLILDTDGDIWTYGHGGRGELGIGERTGMRFPKKLNINLNSRIVSVSAGLNHSLLLFADGNIQGFGSNEYCQIGTDDLYMSLVSKTIEKLKKYKIVQICAGSNHSAALTKDGELFCFGDNRSGQCGVGRGREYKKIMPKKVKLNHKIDFIECGENHSLLITRKHLFYSFGNCQYGQLGHGDKNNKYIPALIEVLKEKKMKTCAAGFMHSLCIDEEGIIWSFGDNKYGQCGYEYLYCFEQQRLKPKVIEWFVSNNIKARDCIAGYNQSSVFADDGSLYMFGSNEEYKLGLNQERAERGYYTPTNLALSVKCLSLGKRLTAAI